MTRYDLTGRTVAITGSTGGLGSALAGALRARGANLALLDLDANLTHDQAHALGMCPLCASMRAIASIFARFWIRGSWR